MIPCSPAHALAELRSGLNELSNPQRSRTDRAIHRRGNHGVGPVKCHLLFDCSGAIQLRVRTSTFLSAASDRIFRAATARSFRATPLRSAAHAEWCRSRSPSIRRNGSAVPARFSAFSSAAAISTDSCSMTGCCRASCASRLRTVASDAVTSAWA
jgi:hypothetical protein